MMNELTKKQRVLYNMMLTTKTYEDMESIMQLSKGGVRYYASVIMSKLGYSSRVELMSDYYRPNQDSTDKKAYCGLDLTELEIGIFNCIVTGFTLSETAEIFKLKKTIVSSKRNKIMRLAKVNGALALICKYYNISDELRAAK
jgi:DNA-binding CsgD family transcriptional regulator